MKIQQMLGIAALSLSMLTGAAFAADKASKQAEVIKVTDAALTKFYAAKPRKTPTKFSLSYSGRRLRQCSARTRGWAGEATPRLQFR